MKELRWAIPLLVLLCGPLARAHVGSPDVYAEGQAGAYGLFVVVRPPLVIPGIADVEVRAQTAGIENISITPVPLTGEASKYPPVPEAMKRPTQDANFFTGHLWIMATGSWQIRLAAHGSQGDGVLSIPAPATALGTRRMTSGLGVMLAALGMFLVVGMVGIVGAAAREAKLPPGATVPQSNRRTGYIAMAITFALLIAGVVLSNAWWKAEAASYSNIIYKPLEMTAALAQGDVLDLKVHDPGWLSKRKLDDLIPDHDHLMHLYLIRWPAMDVVAHLHPQPVGTGEFRLELPSLPAGSYHLYSDVVHADGFPETIVGEVSLPAVVGKPLAGDDTKGAAAAVGAHPEESICNENAPGTAQPRPKAEQHFKLADGYTMVWKRPECLSARTPMELQFELLNPAGDPPHDMALYMGMAGHAAFLKTDGTVFAHIHPTGTVSMAAFMMANPHLPMTDKAMADMPGMHGAQAPLPNAVGFPYGFPSAGVYRIFVQMKHAQTVETGVFDAVVGKP